MKLTIRLLGRPCIEREDGDRLLAGRKTWALLALLALRSTPPTRTELIEVLWPEADDPAGALRWTLARVRKALAPEVEIRSDTGNRLLLVTSPEVVIDARVVTGGTYAPVDVEQLGAGELLEGFTFDDAPLFEGWLALERVRVASAARAALRWAATMRAHEEPERAIEYLARATASDPYDDAAHELAVDIRVASGQRLGAIAYLEAVDRLYRRELGVPAPEQLRRSLDAPIPAAANPLVNLDVSARALLGAARARFDAGDYESAIDAARRASADAAASGLGRLEAEACTLLATILIHSVRGRDQEAVGLLSRALLLAHEAHDAGLASEVEREAGYVAFLAGDYGSAEAALARARSLADSVGDDDLAGRALTILGASRSDRGDHLGSMTALHEGLRRLAAAGNHRWRAYAGTYLGRLLLELDEVEEARHVAAEAVTEARSSGWVSLVPFPLAIEADAALAAGDAEAAAALNGEAYTLAAEMSDPCWEALSLRGLARCQRAAGDPDEARRLLVAAKDRCARYPDTYQWAVAQVLTELAEVENGADRDHVNDARRVAQRGPMAAVIARLDRLVTNRVLATVLFTDIIGSTTIVAELGDRRWQQVLEQHHALVRRQLVIHAGREVDTAGDGFFAAFDGPAQAIRCAAAIMAAARGLGLEERAGLHTGECEMIDGKVGGIAVHIGARVAAAAGPGDVLVSGTVKDLVAGSGIGFLEQGVVELRGVPGLWPLFRVDPASL